MSDSPVEYAVPRNPAIASPTTGEVIAGDPVGRDGWRPSFSDRVHFHTGDRIPPSRASRIDRGRLLALGRGFFFVPTSRHAGWRETLGEIERLAERGTAEGGLEVAMSAAAPALGAVGRAFGEAAVGCFMGETGQDAIRERVGALERRLATTSACALAYVDIVAVRCERAWSWSRPGRVHCAVVALEDDRGRTRSVCLTGPDDRIAAVWLERRFERDVAGIARAVWDELLDMRKVWVAFRGRYPAGSTVVVGRVWDDWQGAVRARMATLGVTPATVAAETARRLAPWLEYYRHIPAVAPRVAAFEALAAGV